MPADSKLSNVKDARVEVSSRQKRTKHDQQRHRLLIAPLPCFKSPTSGL